MGCSGSKKAGNEAPTEREAPAPPEPVADNGIAPSPPPPEPVADKVIAPTKDPTASPKRESDDAMEAEEKAEESEERKDPRSLRKLGSLARPQKDELQNQEENSGEHTASDVSFKRPPKRRTNDEDKKPTSVGEGDDEKVEPQKQSKPRLPTLGLKRPEMGDDVLDIAPVAKLGELPALDFNKGPKPPRDKLERVQYREPSPPSHPEERRRRDSSEQLLDELDLLDAELKGVAKFAGYSKPVQPHAPQPSSDLLRKRDPYERLSYADREDSSRRQSGRLQSGRNNRNARPGHGAAGASYVSHSVSPPRTPSPARRPAYKNKVEGFDLEAFRRANNLDRFLEDLKPPPPPPRLGGRERGATGGLGSAPPKSKLEEERAGGRAETSRRLTSQTRR